MTKWEFIKKTSSRLLEQPGLTLDAVHAGHYFRAVRSSLRREDVNTDAGLIEGRYVFSLLVAADQFDGFPMPVPRRSIVTIGDRQYRVLSLEEDPLGATFRLHLGDRLQ